MKRLGWNMSEDRFDLLINLDHLVVVTMYILSDMVIGSYADSIARLGRIKVALQRRETSPFSCWCQNDRWFAFKIVQYINRVSTRTRRTRCTIAPICTLPMPDTDSVATQVASNWRSRTWAEEVKRWKSMERLLCTSPLSHSLSCWVTP